MIFYFKNVLSITSVRINQINDEIKLLFVPKEAIDPICKYMPSANIHFQNENNEMRTLRNEHAV